MISTPRKWIALVVAAALVGIVTGCIQFPTGPVASQIAQTTTGTQTPASGATLERPATSAGLIGGLDSLITGIDQFAFNTLDIVGTVGGSLTNQRWTVNVPPNAISGDVTIKLGVLSATSSTCVLQITPSTANNFGVPVQLTVDCSSVSADRLQYYAIFWYDPVKATWVPVAGSSVDLQSKTVSAPLEHFSEYSVRPTNGRAGW
jgi:hypothetical protein